uniref:Carn_acyltransf domain-containing protein n=1 Tax=Schistocephalus solidus TaxID=70667 RepID=A0A183SBW1_SCHSO
LPTPSVRRLEWLVDDLLFEGLILPAWQDYEARRADLQINILQTTGILHKSKCKRAGLSPDAMLQLAIQAST